MSDAPEPEPDFVPLRPEERERLEQARAWLKGHFERDAEPRYQSLNAKLDLIRTILDQGWVAPDETWKLQALGVAFGDAMAWKLMLEWVTVSDKNGADPSLNWPGTSPLLNALTMVPKRIEDGRAVDVSALFETACQRVTELVFSGKHI